MSREVVVGGHGQAVSSPTGTAPSRTSTSTASVEFHRGIWSRAEIPEIADAFAARDQIVAESLTVHSGFVRKFAGNPFEVMTGWCADRYGVLVIRLRRPVVSSGGVFRPVGDWRVFEREDRRAKGNPMRTVGTVDPGVGPSFGSGNALSPGKAVPAMQRSGWDTAQYLPPSVQDTMESQAPKPTTWVGEIIQRWPSGSGGIPNCQQIDLLRMTQARAVAVRATRTIPEGRHSMEAASAQLAARPWSVVQVAYECVDLIGYGK